MMDLRTTYLGFDLPHPLIPGASPMVDDLDTVRRLEDAGAPMIIMHSLFEEQITREERAHDAACDEGAESFAEAVSYLPRRSEFNLGPEEYLHQIRRLKETVRVPIVASLNGVTPGGWLKYAQLIAQAGADALELNLYDVTTAAHESSADVESRYLEVVRAVRTAVTMPLAVKLSPFITALPHFARRLDEAGADALVLFNRFYQPDLDVEQLEVVRINLSSPQELNLRLRWIAILHGQLRCRLAITGGVHSALDAVKAVMAGAHGVQMVSALLRHGPAHLAKVRRDLAQWLEEHEYESLRQMQGCLSLERCPDPHAYERANYIRLLQSWGR